MYATLAMYASLTILWKCMFIRLFYFYKRELIEVQMMKGEYVRA